MARKSFKPVVEPFEPARPEPIKPLPPLAGQRELFGERERERMTMPTMDLSKRVKELEQALEESVALQSHYAEQLNEADHGNRLVYRDADDWIRWRRRVASYATATKKKLGLKIADS